jgi:phospholipase/carboxylesterase
MPHVRVDDEAVLWSASAADREGRPLLLLLHGYNSNEGDLFGLAPYLPLEPAIASLRAPIFTGYGHAWFPLMSEGVDLSVDAADASTDAILDWLDRAAPDARSVGLLGFSQAGSMSLE